MNRERRMLTTLLIWLSLLVGGAPPALAQQGEIAAPPALPGRFSVGLGRSEGFGARALGMGGAFLAVADDATAVIWNPAGLGQMSDAQVQVGGKYFSAETERGFTSNTQARIGSADLGGPRSLTEPSQADDPSTKTAAEFVAYAYPFYVGAGRMVVALSASEGKTDFGANALVIPNYLMEGRELDNRQYQYRGKGEATFSQQGSQRSYAASLAYNLEDRYLFGITAAQLDGALDLQSTRGLQQLGLFRCLKSSCDTPADFNQTFGQDGHQYFRNETIWRTSQKGVYAILGLMIRPSDQWTLAGVYRTKSDVDLNYRVSDQLSGSWAFTQDRKSVANYFLHGIEGTSSVTIPALYGAGIAFRPTPRWTIAAEYSATDWSNSTFDVNVNGQKQTFLYPSFRPVGQPAWIAASNLSSRDRFSFEQFRSGIFRVGMEYVIPRGGGRYVPVRFGVVREEAVYGLPGEAQPVIWGYSAGIGYLGKRVFVDLAVLYDEMTQKVSSSTPFLSEEPYYQFSYSGAPSSFFPQYITLTKGEYSQRLMRAILSAGVRF